MFGHVRFGTLYRGIIPPIMVEAPKRATKFAANEQYTILYRNILGQDVNKQALSILTGVSAGITEVMQKGGDNSCFIVFPWPWGFFFCYSVFFMTVAYSPSFLSSVKIGLPGCSL